jgi:hypothetical protein
MELNIKQAADSLLKKGEITKEEYDSIDFEKTSELFKGAAVPRFVLPKEFINALTDIDAMKGYAKHLAKNPDLVRTQMFEQAMKKIPGLAEEYAKQTSKKPGFLQSIGNNYQKLWIVPATVGATFVAKEGLVDPIVQGVKINSSFNKMIGKTPQLEEADQEKVRDYFDVIKTYSPHAAANPLVAGALVNKMMEFGGVDHKLVQDLINIQSGRTGMEAMKSMVGSGINTISKPSKED